MTRIFISHSHLDEEIAKKLVEYLLAALTIENDEIRCTSVAGYKLPPGTNIEDHLRNDINGDIALIGLLTKHGLRSQWVLFELGAAWGGEKQIISILGPGLKDVDLPGPLKNYQPISIENEKVTYDLNYMIRVLADYLKVVPKHGISEEPKRDEFIQQLKAWESQLPDPDVSQQKQIEELTKKLEELEQLNSKQLLEIQQLEQKLEQERRSQQQHEPTKLEPQIKSENGIDYIKLRDLLAQKKWKEADEETYNLMIQTLNKNQGDWFSFEDLVNFPCEDLRTINQLWVDYSGGHFGFSVQKDIYQSLHDHNRWQNFCNNVGWKEGESNLRYSELTFDINAPKGHLPFVMGTAVVNRDDRCIFSRLESCNS